MTVEAAVAKGEYCIYALSTKHTSMYGYDKNAEVLFTDSTADRIRTVAVADHMQAPDFRSGPCTELVHWTRI